MQCEEAGNQEDDECKSQGGLCCEVSGTPSSPCPMTLFGHESLISYLMLFDMMHIDEANGCKWKK